MSYRAAQGGGDVGKFVPGPRYAGAPIDRIFIPNIYYHLAG
jgi:hypothetical protein